MNCKPGDLAVVVRTISRPERLGMLVTIIRPYQNDAWIVEPMCGLPSPAGWYAPDWGLRPLRDSNDDAQDETLSWLPVPSKEIA